MNIPFCDKCKIAKSCVQDLILFKSITGNKRIPPKSFCREQYKKANEEIYDFFRNCVINSTDNPSSLLPIFPELKEPLYQQIEKDWCIKNNKNYEHEDKFLIKETK